MKLFAVKFRQILEVFSMQALSKRYGRIFSINASKNGTVCREFQTHFESPLPARFAEKVHSAISRFMRPKTKLFAVKFQGILEVFFMQAL